MDTYLSEEEILLHGRFRTRRQKIRKAKDGKNKHLRKLDRISWKLEMKKRKLEYKDLEKPVFRGYKRFFVLREDVADSKEADFFQSILDKINTTQYSNTKRFLKSKSKKNKKKKSAHEVKEQHVRFLYASEFKKTKFTTAQKKYFEERKKFIRHTKMYKKYYVFKEAWRFVLKIEKHFYTKEKVIDWNLELEIAELDAHIRNNFLQYKMNKLKHGNVNNYKWYGLTDRYKHPFTGFSKEAILDEYYYNKEE